MTGHPPTLSVCLCLLPLRLCSMYIRLPHQLYTALPAAVLLVLQIVLDSRTSDSRLLHTIYINAFHSFHCRATMLEREMRDPRSICNVDCLLDTVSALVSDCDHDSLKRLKNIEQYAYKCE